MRRSVVLFGGLALTALLFYGLGRLLSVSPPKEEPAIVVMPQRWLELERRANPDEPLQTRPIANGLVAVVHGSFDTARESVPATWFLHPERLKGTPMIAADRLIDADDPAAVAKLMKRVQLLAVSGQVPMDGVWKYAGGAWQRVELPRALQEAIDDVAYAAEAQLMPKRHALERDHSTEHSVVELNGVGELAPPAERVRFKGACEGKWEDALQKVPGALVREKSTVLEWYRVERFPTPEECGAL